MTENDNFKVPFSAKIGWVITWILMVVILVMLGKNFIGSFVFGVGTKNSEIDTYHEMGFSDAKVGEESRLDRLGLDNPLFKKAYKNGYREGIDEKWLAEKNAKQK